VTAGSGCAWTAASNALWIHVRSGAAGSGNGTVNVEADENILPLARSGTVTIGGQTYTANQNAAPVDMTVEGQVTELSGSCPAWSFKVEGTSIVTNVATTYKDLKCSELKNGTDVKVNGLRQLDGSVVATRVDKK
jgi:Domain of unknown function (DUF5666)